MVLIPGGTFQMGSIRRRGLFSLFRDNKEFPDEKPSHSVRLDSFYMGKYEVTNKEYCEFLNFQGNQSEGGVTWIAIEDNKYCGIEVGSNPGTYKIKVKYEKHPVVHVSWYGAVAYCNWLSEEEGLEKCYGEKGKRVQVDITKNGYRLSTEAEWEYACRGGTITDYYWGDSMDVSYCWYLNNSGGNHYPVGQKKPNVFGLYDMSGNVWEWCSDWYGNYSSGSVNNPTGPDSGLYRVCRGGCCYCDAGYCRSASRCGFTPDGRYDYLGFRLCRSALNITLGT